MNKKKGGFDPREIKRRERKLKSKRNLHPAAKMKRILSATDYWFSRENLREDLFMRRRLEWYQGWIPIETLLTFPKFKFWTDAKLLVEAYTNIAATKRYEIMYSKALYERGNAIESLEKKIQKERRRNERELREKRKKGKEASPSFFVEDSPHVLNLIKKQNELISAGLDVSADVGDDQPVLRHAMLRHKTRSLDSEGLLDDDDDDDDDMIQDLADVEDSIDNDPKELDACTSKKTPVQLPKYESKRPVVIVKNHKELTRFCDMLLVSVNKFAEQHPDAPDARALGFDVEYCTFELDIRGTLPALLQLAAPASDGPVGLIWLDKFAKHGKNMIGAPEYGSLLSILGDPSVLKVGVGASKDARNLAEWWGITDRRFDKHYFSGILNLEDEYELHTSTGGSLADITQEVLHKRLDKRKQPSNRKRKRQKTAHWRTEEMTSLMKKYAANDASSAIDIWNARHGFD